VLCSMGLSVGLNQLFVKFFPPQGGCNKIKDLILKTIHG
jgi:hypothetical protein